MNISIWKKPLGLLLSILITPIFASEAPDLMGMDGITQEQIDEQRNIWEGQLTAIKDQFNRLDLNLQDLALLVNNDKIKTAENKRALIEEIVAIRSLISSIQKDPFVHVDPITNIKLIHILNSIVDHVKKAVNDGFSTLAPYDINATMKRIGAIEIDIATMNVDGEMAQLQKNIEDFELSSKNIGLAWYNKVYRKFDDAVIQPSIKHNLVPRVAKAALVTSLAWWTFWFRSERGTRKENLPPFPREENKEMINTPAEVERILAESNNHREKKDYYGWEYRMRDFVGAYPHISPSQGGLATHHESDFHYKGKNQLGIIGLTELKIWEFLHNHLVVAAVALPYIAPMLKAEADTACEWLSKKTLEFHNRMKGGIYSQEAYSSSTRNEPKITFDDLVGLDYAKNELSMILRFIEDPERWSRSGLKIEKGYLLTGPTRTGKSYIAEALSGEIRKILTKQNRNPEEFGFYSITASMIKQNSLGALLEMAKREAPCVLFIDEIDLLQLARNANADLLSDFLQSLSGILSSGDSKKPVFILAATNKPQVLDHALKQRGRFGKEIRFEYPSFKERKQFLFARLTDLAVNTDEINIDKLVYETSGISYEDLNALIRSAFQKAKIFGKALNQELLENALDSEIRQIRIEAAKNIPLEQRQIIAAHQAGHVLATMLLPTGQKVAKVTILPVQNKLEDESIWTFGQEKIIRKDDEQAPIENGKMFTYSKHDTLNVLGKKEKLNVCMIHLAGHIAEEILLGECGYSYHVSDCIKGCSDPEKALPIALSIVGSGIRIDDKTSKEMRDKFEAQAFKLIDTCKQDIRVLLEQHKETLKVLAQQLQEKMTLTGAEIEAIIAKTSPIAKPAEDQSKAPATNAPAVSAEAVEKALGIKEEQPA